MIHGDNLLALKALEQKFSGKIKCIYIDPPYNTGSAFSTYDDNLEHSTWLSLMKPRIEILRKLLTNDGSIWISIDSEECHYLKVMADEILGRNNFVEEVIWQRSYAPINLKKHFREIMTLSSFMQKRSQIFKSTCFQERKKRIRTLPILIKILGDHGLQGQYNVGLVTKAGSIQSSVQAEKLFSLPRSIVGDIPRKNMNS